MKIMDKLDAVSIDHVNMKVRNLKDSLKFYNDLFGFEVKKEDNPNKSDVPSLIIGNNSIIEFQRIFQISYLHVYMVN